MTELIFVVPGMKVNGQYYCDVLLSQQMLPACCKRYVCLSTRQSLISSCKDTYKQLQQETPDFWPPNSPDPNLVDYKFWGVMQQRVYECHEQCRWAEAAPHWRLEQSAAERYWRDHQRVEKATESMCACRWTTLWTLYWERVWLTKVMEKWNTSNFVYSQKDALLLPSLWFSGS